MRARLALLVAVALVLAIVVAPALAPAWGEVSIPEGLEAPDAVVAAAAAPALPSLPSRELVARLQFRGPPRPSSVRYPEIERPAGEARWRREGIDGRVC